MRNEVKMNENKILERKAVIIASCTAFLLATIKFIAGIYSGSVVVLSSAIDSMLDLLVSALNFFALKKSQAEPNASCAPSQKRSTELVSASLSGFTLYLTVTDVSG